MRHFICTALILLGARPGGAHFNMLLPQSPSVSRGQPVSILYQWGHPFEHELFDAPAPTGVFVRSPDGKRTDLAGALQKLAEPGQRTRFQLRFTPPRRGDYTFVLTTPPIWMNEEEEFLQDTVKVVLHVQAQKGWDRPTGQEWEFVPLTRPYGLLPGTVFQARVAAPAALVEIERYNPAPPKDLPPDEFVTRTVMTDPAGVVTCSLTEPGWWCLTAGRHISKREHEGKTYPVRQRTTLWVFVNETARPQGK